MSDPIKVLQIVTQMNRAGLESRLMDIYRNIDRSKVQFDFYTCRTEKGFFDDEIVSLGGKVFYSEPLYFKQIFNVPKRFYSFLSIYSEYKIVHCHLNQWCGAVLNGAEKANVPIRIAHSRTSLETKDLKNFIKNVIKFSVNKYATHRFAVSRKAGVWLYGKKVFDSEVVEIWPNAIDCSKFKFEPTKREEYRKELNLLDSFTLIHVGNIRPEKNHKFLIDVFKEIKKEQNNAKLLVVGSDYMSGEIHRYVEEHGVGKNVIFLGPRSDVSNLLQAGDVFVFPSLYEGFPGAVLEAQASGLPCYISDTITEEVCVTNLVKRISLQKPIEYWKEQILNNVNINRINTYDILKSSGYDIHSVSERYSFFYTNIINEIGE
ncbi:MAG TPA: glycosyltransferase family 1 protein [Clostridiales bacterium]|nr:glycosyltransferase family 1 protein [Clostridiales bacterium]